jgi:hypothetical protein
LFSFKEGKRHDFKLDLLKLKQETMVKVEMKINMREGVKDDRKNSKLWLWLTSVRAGDGKILSIRGRRLGRFHR